MPSLGRMLYWVFTIAALVCAGLAAFEFASAETAKGNAMMHAALYIIAAAALWSFGRAILRALAGK